MSNIKKLTPADKKFIDRFFGLSLDAVNGEKVIRMNRFSGAAFEVDAITAAAIDFVFKLERVLHMGRTPMAEQYLKAIHPALKTTNAVSNFDRARYIAMKLSPEAYMGILD